MREKEAHIHTELKYMQNVTFQDRSVNRSLCEHERRASSCGWGALGSLRSTGTLKLNLEKCRGEEWRKREGRSGKKNIRSKDVGHGG